MLVCLFKMAYNGSADLRSPEKEVYFRSWDLANSECKLLQTNIQKLVQILYFQSINNSILKTHCCAKSPGFEFQCSSEPLKTLSFYSLSVNFVIEYSYLVSRTPLTTHQLYDFTPSSLITPTSSNVQQLLIWFLAFY